MESIERDVVKNSEYIISYYKINGKTITNLEVQKLAYFLEAIYMVYTDEEYLYNEEFSAWNFGPVNTKIYNQYKNFGSVPIELDHEVIINQNNLKFIQMLYELFKSFNATQLVNLSHIKGSPWYEIYSQYKGTIPRGKMISKRKTKEWFNTLVDIIDE